MNRDLPEGLVEATALIIDERDERTARGAGIRTPRAEGKHLLAAAFAYRDEHGVQWAYHRDEVFGRDLTRWRERAEAAEAQVEELRRERGTLARVAAHWQNSEGVLRARLSEYVEALRALCNAVLDDDATPLMCARAIASALLSQESETPDDLDFCPHCYGRGCGACDARLLSQESENG